MDKSKNQWTRDAALGVAVWGLSFWLGPGRRVEPFYTYFYFFAWAPFLVGLARELKRRGAEAPGLAWREAPVFLFFSTTAWLVFEVLNARLDNWSYIGVPSERFIRWPGYALSFATVAPGIFYIAALRDSRDWRTESPPLSSTPARWSFYTGAAMLALSMAFPRYFFALVWGAFFFLLEPWIWNEGGRSLLRDWAERRWKRTGAVLLSGAICGLYWEACNYGAGAKWIYHVPFVGDGRLFEMPFLGFLGFPPFALELHSMHEAFRLARRRLSGPLKQAALLAILLFWVAAFWMIDRFTVVSVR